MKRFEQVRVFPAFPIKSETWFSVNLSNLDSIHIFQCKEGIDLSMNREIRNLFCVNSNKLLINDKYLLTIMNFA